MVLTFKLNHKSWISLGLTQENITVTFTGPFRNLKLHESDIKSFNTGSKLTVNGFNWGTHYNQSLGEEMLRSLNVSNSSQDYKIIFHEEFVSCFHHLMDVLESVWTWCFDSLYILPQAHSDGLNMVLAAVMVFDSLIKYLVSDDKRAWSPAGRRPYLI